METDAARGARKELDAIESVLLTLLDRSTPQSAVPGVVRDACSRIHQLKEFLKSEQREESTRQQLKPRVRAVPASSISAPSPKELMFPISIEVSPDVATWMLTMFTTPESALDNESTTEDRGVAAAPEVLARTIGCSYFDEMNIHSAVRTGAAREAYASACQQLFSIFFGQTAAFEVRQYAMKLHEHIACQTLATRTKAIGVPRCMAVMLQMMSASSSGIHSFTDAEIAAALAAAIIIGIVDAVEPSNTDFMAAKKRTPLVPLFSSNGALLKEGFAAYIGLSLLEQEDLDFTRILFPKFADDTSWRFSFGQLVLSLCNASSSTHFAKLTDSIRRVNRRDNSQVRFLLLEASIFLSAHSFHWFLTTSEFSQCVYKWAERNHLILGNSQSTVVTVFECLLAVLLDVIFPLFAMVNELQADCSLELPQSAECAFEFISLLDELLPLEWRKLMEINLANVNEKGPQILPRFVAASFTSETNLVEFVTLPIVRQLVVMSAPQQLMVDDDASPLDVATSASQQLMSLPQRHYVLIRFLAAQLVKLWSASLPHERAAEVALEEFATEWVRALIGLQLPDMKQPLVLHPTHTNPSSSSHVRDLRLYFFEEGSDRELVQRRVDWCIDISKIPPPHPHAAPGYLMDPIVVVLTQMWCECHRLRRGGIDATSGESASKTGCSGGGVATILQRYREFDQRLHRDAAAMAAWKKSKETLFRKK